MTEKDFVCIGNNTWILPSSVVAYMITKTVTDKFQVRFHLSNDRMLLSKVLNTESDAKSFICDVFNAAISRSD